MGHSQIPNQLAEVVLDFSTFFFFFTQPQAMLFLVRSENCHKRKAVKENNEH